VAQPQVGDKAARTRTVSERDIELFTELTGDRNPLHYDREAAAGSRFGGIIVQGGVTRDPVSRCSSAAARRRSGWPRPSWPRTAA
jgi:acyl dehydratase